MKRIITKRFTDLELLTGSSEWYWGADYAGRTKLTFAIRRCSLDVA